MPAYEFTCEQGHDPLVFATAAQTTDEAVAAFGTMDEVRHHLNEAHQEMSDAEWTEIMRSMTREIPK